MVWRINQLTWGYNEIVSPWIGNPIHHGGIAIVSWPWHAWLWKSGNMVGPLKFEAIGLWSSLFSELASFRHGQAVPPGKLTVCYWTWPFIVDLPIKKGWFTHQKRQFSLVILVYQRVQYLFHPIISTRMKNWSNSLNITLSAPRVWRTSAWEWTVQWDCRTHLGVSINGGTPRMDGF